MKLGERVTHLKVTLAGGVKEDDSEMLRKH
jgi:hypothetical protein